MCCLFGILDYGGRLTRKEKTKILSVLSVACEERGTDATGIAYNSGDSLRIFGAVAELEREYILQRQKEGIAIAKANGTYKG